MWKRRLAAAFALVAGLTVVVAGAPFVLLVLDEGAIPPAHALPPLPSGVDASEGPVECGSGGCWRSFTLRGPSGESAEEFATRLDMPTEQCRARSLVDRRRVCSGLTLAHEEVVLYLQYDRRLLP